MIPLAIRKLSCNSTLRRVGRQLHVNHMVRRVYCRLLSRSGRLEVSCLGVRAVFTTGSSQQLAFLDYIITSESEIMAAALCTLKTGDAFLDVGSHYGVFSVFASKIVGATGRVIAIEPHPESLRALRENLDVNLSKNVEILKIALSDVSGPVSLAYNEHFATLQRSSDAAETLHVARALTGDEAISHSPIPAAVKIDVEGHEFAVLKGLRQTVNSSFAAVTAAAGKSSVYTWESAAQEFSARWKVV